MIRIRGEIRDETTSSGRNVEGERDVVFGRAAGVEHVAPVHPCDETFVMLDVSSNTTVAVHRDIEGVSVLEVKNHHAGINAIGSVFICGTRDVQLSGVSCAGREN